MAAGQQCPQCGSPLPGGDAEGLCVKCLARLALSPDPKPERPPPSASPGPAPDRDTAIEPRLSPIPEQVGDQIGRFKLLQVLGEGGFGVVYMAEQREPIKRKVALKIIKVGMDTREVVTRFEAERQALALMDHPNIAKIYDAGVTGAAESEIS